METNQYVRQCDISVFAVKQGCQINHSTVEMICSYWQSTLTYLPIYF